MGDVMKSNGKVVSIQDVTLESLSGSRAEGYVRDSNLDQRDGFGPDIQRQNIERFAQNYGLVLGNRWYTEFESGRSVAKRLEFQALTREAAQDRFDVLLVDHTSRFGRNQAECIRYKQQLTDLGKIVVFVSQGIISGSERDFLTERINETLDEQYSRNLSRYVREGKARKADAGHALGHAPLGYRHEKARSGRGAWAVPDEETIPILLALLRGYASGDHSFKSLALELNAAGHTTRRGNPFTEGSISTVLNNPFYDGKFYLHKGSPDQELREGVHDVPDEVRSLWKRCQEVRREKAFTTQPSPRSRQHRVYPLTGVLVCDNCDRPFHGVSTVSKPRSYPRMFHHWHRCSMRPLSVAAPSLEQDFSRRVLSCIRMDEGWQAAVLKAMTNEGPTPDYSLERRRIETAMANLKKQHMWGVVPDEEFKAEYRTLGRQLKLLQPVRSAVQTIDIDRAGQLLKDLPALWEHPGVTAEQRRDLAREVFEEVRISSGKLVAVRPKPDYVPIFAYHVWRQHVVGGNGST